MRATLPLLASGLMLSLFTLTTAPTLAQIETACNFDLSDTTALLMQAQAKASGGDMDAGLLLLTQAQQNLNDIQAACGSEATSMPNVPALMETYSPPSKSFSLSYPEGWITALVPVSDNNENPPLEAIFLASNQATVDAVQNNKPSENIQGVAVYVGSGPEIVIGLGAFQPNKNYYNLCAKGLLTAIIDATPAGSPLRLGAAKAVSIGDQAAAEITFSATAPGSAEMIYDGDLLIVPFTDHCFRYAALVGVISPGRTADIQALVHAVAASIKRS